MAPKVVQQTLRPVSGVIQEAVSVVKNPQTLPPENQGVVSTAVRRIPYGEVDYDKEPQSLLSQELTEAREKYLSVIEKEGIPSKVKEAQNQQKKNFKSIVDRQIAALRAPEELRRRLISFGSSAAILSAIALTSTGLHHVASALGLPYETLHLHFALNVLSFLPLLTTIITKWETQFWVEKQNGLLESTSSELRELSKDSHMYPFIFMSGIFVMLPILGWNILNPDMAPIMVSLVYALDAYFFYMGATNLQIRKRVKKIHQADEKYQETVFLRLGKGDIEFSELIYYYLNDKAFFEKITQERVLRDKNILSDWKKRLTSKENGILRSKEFQNLSPEEQREFHIKLLRFIYQDSPDLMSTEFSFQGFRQYARELNLRLLYGDYLEKALAVNHISDFNPSEEVGGQFELIQDILKEFDEILLDPSIDLGIKEHFFKTVVIKYEKHRKIAIEHNRSKSDIYNETHMPIDEAKLRILYNWLAKYHYHSPNSERKWIEESHSRLAKLLSSQIEETDLSLPKDETYEPIQFDESGVLSLDPSSFDLDLDVSKFQSDLTWKDFGQDGKLTTDVEEVDFRVVINHSGKEKVLVLSLSDITKLMRLNSKKLEDTYLPEEMTRLRQSLLALSREITAAYSEKIQQDINLFEDPEFNRLRPKIKSKVIQSALREFYDYDTEYEDDYQNEMLRRAAAIETNLIGLGVDFWNQYGASLLDELAEGLIHEEPVVKACILKLIEQILVLNEFDGDFVAVNDEVKQRLNGILLAAAK